MNDQQLIERVCREVALRETDRHPHACWSGKLHGSVYSAWLPCPVQGPVGMIALTIPRGGGGSGRITSIVTGS